MAKDQKSKDSKVQVRVLAECSLGKCNDVVEVDQATLAQAKAIGQVDDHHDAVAYALSLQKQEAAAAAEAVIEATE